MTIAACWTGKPCSACRKSGRKAEMTPHGMQPGTPCSSSSHTVGIRSKSPQRVGGVGGQDWAALPAEAAEESGSWSSDKGTGQGSGHWLGSWSWSWSEKLRLLVVRAAVPALEAVKEAIALLMDEPRTRLGETSRCRVRGCTLPRPSPPRAWHRGGGPRLLSSEPIWGETWRGMTRYGEAAATPTLE